MPSQSSAGGYAWAKKHLPPDPEGDRRYERRVSERNALLSAHTNTQAWGAVGAVSGESVRSAGGGGGPGDFDINLTVRALPVADRFRKMQDIWALLLFVLLWVVVLIVAVSGASHSQFQKLTYGTDVHGNTCGINNLKYDTSLEDSRKLPYLFFFPESQTERHCVESCPTHTLQADITNPHSYVCIPGLSPSPNTTESLHRAIRKGQCSSGVFRSRTFLHRCRTVDPGDTYLNPLNNKTVTTKVTQLAMYKEIDTYGVSVRVLADLASSVHWIIWCAAFSCACAYLWIYLMKRAIAHVMWGMIGGAIFLMALATIKSYVMYATHSTRGSGPYHTRAQSTNQTVLLIMAIVSTAVTAAVVYLVIRLRRKLDKAIVVIQEASRTLSAMPALFTVPIATVTVLIVVFMEWVFVALALGSAGSITMDPATDIATWTFDSTLSHMEIWNTLLLLWTLNVVLSVGQTIIAHAVSAYYFTPNKETVSGVFSLQAAVYTVAQFHLGSIVLGSFLIATIQWIRWLLRSIRHQAKDSKSTAAVWAYRSVSCLMDVVSAVVDLLSLNAFIQIAMTGDDFMTSARRGSEQLRRNALGFTVVQFVADLLLFLGKICVSSVSMFVAFNLTSHDAEMQMFSIPVLICFAISWTVASGVMNVYKVAIDTVFMCYCEDNELNDGDSKPFALPDPTRSLVSAYAEIV